MLQWSKRFFSLSLGKYKDTIKNMPIIKQLNSLANKQRLTSRQKKLTTYFYDVLSVVYNHNIPHFKIWLDFGTLLGFYREKGIIAHDLDMDFGVMLEDFEQFSIFETYLLNNNFIKTREFYYENNLVELSYSYRGLNIDFIFYIYDKTNQTITSTTVVYVLNAFNKPVQIESYQYYIPFNNQFLTHSYKDIHVIIPSNTQEYLSALYGDQFMIPNPRYNWQKNPTYHLKSNDTAKIILH